MEKRVEFKCKGDLIRGILYTPDHPKSVSTPLVVMAGGWCYTKEIVMPYYAREFSSRGIAALAIDYRNSGESEGSPRQHLDPWMQIEDYRTAITYAQSLPGIDANRIGTWGISYSGGHSLILAAIDSRVRFAVSTIPVVDGFSTERRCHGETRFNKLIQLLNDDRKLRFETGGPGAPFPMSSLTPDSEMSCWPFPHVYEAFMDIKAREAERHEHWSTMESVDLLLNYTVFPYCPRIHDKPVLMTVAHGDNITSADLEVAAFNAISSSRKQLEIVEGVTHMSLYSNVEHLKKVSRIQASWLEKTLEM